MFWTNFRILWSNELEVQGIADGEVAVGMRGYDPIDNNQLTKEEIDRCEKDEKA